MAFIAIFLSQPAEAQLQMDREKIDSISMAVVQVYSIGSDEPGSLMDGYNLGSGSLVEGTNLMYTNRHVAEDHYEFIIHALIDLNDTARPVFRAELVGFSDEYDFAVLRITEDMEGVPVTNPHHYLAELSDQGQFPQLLQASMDIVLGRGDQIAIFGYPSVGDNELVFTTGIISSVQYDEVYGESMPVWFRTNAEMSPGNSGGVVTNMGGEMIGIPTYVRSESVTGGRLGSLLSMQVVHKILEENALLERWSDSVSGIMTEMYGGEALDYSLDPTYGSTSLSAGFTPDPFSVPVFSGGDINASYVEGADCIGYAAASPDFRLQWTGSGPFLRMYFEGEGQDDDTVLLINRPDGSWICNDDANDSTINPLVQIDQPEEGQYDIWVASYDDGQYFQGRLFISELSSEGPVSGGSSETNGSAFLDFNDDPTYGLIELKSGFAPSPHSVEVVSGGSIDVAAVERGTDCLGYAAKAPDLSLSWSGSSSNLRVYYEADDPADDTVLIINTPDGQWICNDDAHEDTLNPQLNLSSFDDGRYDIWVGSYYEDEFINGKLFITESDARP